MNLNFNKNKPQPQPLAAPARIQQAVQPATASSIFAGVEQARVMTGSNYVRDGRYFALVNRVKEGKNRNNVGFVAIEMTILVILPGMDAMHREGEEVSHLLSSNKPVYFLSDLKKFIAVAGNGTVDEVTLDICKQVSSDDNPMGGTLIEFEAKTIVTKEKKQDFTVVTYRRTVPAIEVAEKVRAEIADQVMGKGVLEALVAKEAQ